MHQGSDSRESLFGHFPRGRRKKRGAEEAMIIIGITGGVGSGKSELLKYIGSHYKAFILRSDEAAHAVSLVPGGSVYHELVSLLAAHQKEGDGPLCQEDGSIDHREMAARIFREPALREEVNAIVHPAVRVYIDNAIKEAGESGKYDFFFLEAALLIECGYKSVVDSMWYIHADEAIRRKRLKESRGYSEEKTSAIMKSQLSDAAFRENADVVIDNSGPLESAFRQIDEALAKWYHERR